MTALDVHAAAWAQAAEEAAQAAADALEAAWCAEHELEELEEAAP